MAVRALREPPAALHERRPEAVLAIIRQQDGADRGARIHGGVDPDARGRDPEGSVPKPVLEPHRQRRPAGLAVAQVGPNAVALLDDRDEGAGALELADVVELGVGRGR
jgi:hypothetical protein